MESFLSDVQSLAPALRELRHGFHQQPELGGQEAQTARTIEQVFASLGVPTRRVGATGVIAELTGALPGPAAAFRADMDALPIEEQTGASFCSETGGVMHACGHDFHMTCALGAAMLLAGRRDRLRGGVRFLFEPDEEGDGGAKGLIAAGALDGVSAVFGAHVSPELPAGTFGFRIGKFYAASNPFRIAVTGRTAHGAEPEKGIDALYAAARMACALKELQSPLTQRFGRSVVTVGTLQSGSACNILPGEASLSGILRTLGPEARREGLKALTETVSRIARETGVQARLDVTDGYPGVVNPEEPARLAMAACEDLPARAVWLDRPTMMTEDFGYYLDNVPGSFYHIGVGGGEPLHSPRFLPSDSLLITAAAVHAAILWKYTQEDSSCRPSL
jgi:amidohydrolase